MATRIPTPVQNAGADAMIQADGGELRIYTGAQPASANDPVSGTLLVTFSLASPAFGPASAGAKPLLGTPLSGTGVADGEAGWFRVVNSTDDTVFDGAVGTELTLATTTISVGLTVNLTGDDVTVPPEAVCP